MTPLRMALVGATSASLLLVPAGATAISPTATAPAAPAESAATSTDSSRLAAAAAVQGRYNTWIRFLRFDHTRPWSSRVRIKGQLAARKDGQVGALKGRRVTLYRQYDGRSRWVRLETRRTSQEARPKFRFTVRARANADYRVAFAGNRRFQPTRDKTHVSVYRIFNAKLRDGSGRFHGKVQPRYRNKVIRLEKRRCASCGWDVVRSKRTGDYGRWRFNVGAPRSGRWWWRVSTPGSTKFIRSHSGVFTTELN